MSTVTQSIRRRAQRAPHLDMAMLLNAVPNPVVALDEAGRFVFVNSAAETFLGGSTTVLAGQRLDSMLPADSPLFRMIEQVRSDGSSRSDHELILESPRLGTKVADVQVAPVSELPGIVVVSLQERSIAHRMYRQLNYQGAARSVTALAAMMAHEVKNPLSGIRGAAQLLEQGLQGDDVTLTRLICDETDRICRLVDRMESFADPRPIEKGPVNIHEVIDHTRKIAQTGFGRHVAFVDRYDPSLPAVLGNRELLIQVFLNLL